MLEISPDDVGDSDSPEGEPTQWNRSAARNIAKGCHCCFSPDATPSFEQLLACRLQQLQAFVLEEVARVSENSAGQAFPPYFDEGKGFLEESPPQPPLLLTPELLLGLDDDAFNTVHATSASSLLEPTSRSLPRANSLDSFLSGGAAGFNRLKKSPSNASWRTSEQSAAEDQLTIKSGTVRIGVASSSSSKANHPDPSLGQKVAKEDPAQGLPSASGSSLSSQVKEGPSEQVIRATKLEEVLSAMYYQEVGGSERRRSAEALGFRVRFVNDSNFQSIVIDVVLTIFVILNIILMGLQTEFHPGAFFWNIVDLIFVVAFTLALFLRIVTQGLRETLVTGPDRSWNWFEASQIVVGWTETLMHLHLVEVDSGMLDASFFSLLRMVRMIRITRILRICRMQIFSELLVMVVGTLGGMKTLIWAVALTAVPMYALSIMFRQTIGESGGEAGRANFGSFPMAFFTIFRCTVSSECSDEWGRPIMKLVAEQDGWGYVAIFCLMEFFMTFGLYNVVQGIFLENVLAGAKTNELALKRERLRNQAYFAEKMAELLTVVVRTLAGDTPTSGEVLSVADLLVAAADLSITPEALDKIRKSPEVLTVLKELAVSDEDMMYLFETLDADGDGRIDLQEFVEGISKLRGGPRRSDIIANGFMLQKVMAELQDQGTSTAMLLAQHERVLRSLRKAILGESGRRSSSPRPSRRSRSLPRLIVQQKDGTLTTHRPGDGSESVVTGRSSCTDDHSSVSASGRRTMSAESLVD